MQWKMIYLARRNPALAPQDFAEAWRGHSSLGRQCRNVQDKVLGVTQCSRLLQQLPAGCNAEFDGVNLLRLRDRAAADDIWNDPETLAIMRPDEPRVFDRYVRDFTLVAAERVLRGKPAGQAVLVAFLRRPSGQPVLDFCQALEAPIAAAWPLARCVVLNSVEPARPPGYDFDAIVEWWFDDADALLLSLQQQPLQQFRAHTLDQLCANSASVFVSTGVTHRRP